ncbi:MAG: acylphosphatase [Hyphomicrobiales bacterium]|nr:acylphosphatase [Hyphomicrobiales bacterium]
MVVAEGVVQGVGYREFTRRWALRLNISGWVRNRGDGSVEARVRGQPRDVEAMLLKLREGPPGASVLDLRVTADEGEGEAGFSVRPTL